MTRITGLSAVFGALMLLSGCASIVEGTDQTVTMNISPTSAVCSVSQKGNVIATLDNGGGQVQVPKSKNDLGINCSAEGFKKQSMSIESSASGWGVVGCFLIDLCITDYSTGALNKYPKTITVNLQPQVVAAPAGAPNAAPAAPGGASPTAYPNAYAPYANPGAPDGYAAPAAPQVQGGPQSTYPYTYPATVPPGTTSPEGRNPPAVVQPSAGP